MYRLTWTHHKHDNGSSDFKHDSNHVPSGELICDPSSVIKLSCYPSKKCHIFMSFHFATMFSLLMNEWTYNGQMIHFKYMLGVKRVIGRVTTDIKLDVVRDRRH